MIRTSGLPAFFLLLTCIAIRCPWNIRVFAYSLVWLIFLLFARGMRKRTFILVAVVLGLVMTNSHLRFFGTRAFLNRYIATMDALCSDVSGSSIDTRSDETGSGFSALLTRAQAALGSDVRCALTDSAGDLLAWTDGIEPVMLERSPRIRLIPTGNDVVLSSSCDVEDGRLHINLPLEIGLVSSSPLSFTDELDVPGKISVPWPVGEDVVLFAMISALFLVLIEITAKLSWGTAVVFALVTRMVLRYTITSDGLFGPVPFASFVPFFDSAGDIFLSTAILFLLTVSPEVRFRRGNTNNAVSTLISVTAILFCCILVGGVFLWGSRRLVVDEFSYGALLMSPAFLALFISLLLISITLARLPALFYRSWRADVILVGIAILLAVNERMHIGGLILLMMGLSRLFVLQPVSRVTRWTGMMIWSILFLIPLGTREYDRMRHRHVEDLSRQIAEPGLPWFNLLAREAISETRFHTDLHDIWNKSSLSKFPVMGEIIRLDSMDVIRNRFSFGYTSMTPPGSYRYLDGTGNRIARGVADDIVPPLSTIEIRDQAGRDQTSIMIRLIADMAAPLLSGISALADGTQWPPDLQLIDRGLISDIQPGLNTAMGWSTTPHDGSEKFGFQREFADGPHLMSIQIEAPGPGSSILVLFAILGFVSIMGQLSLGLWNIWVAPSPGKLFFRYRDRLLPFLLIIAVPPLAAILLLGPWAERRVLDAQTERRLRVRMDELSARFRTETIENARVIARHVNDDSPDTTFHWSGETVAFYDSLGLCNGGDTLRGRIISPPMVRSVLRTGRPLMMLPEEMEMVAAVVPGGDVGAIAVFQPLYVVLSRLSAAMPDVSMGVWKDGKRVAAAIKPPCEKVAERIGYNPQRFRKAGYHEMSSRLENWNIRSISDDIHDEALTLGIRREPLGRSSRLETAIQLWGLGILLPSIAVIVFLSSWAAGLVSKPISEMTALARRVQTDKLDVRWPTPAGELGQLALALKNMTNRLIESRVDAEQRRIYLSAVLSQITSAVVVAREDGSVELANPPAEKLLALPGFTGYNDTKSLLEGPLGDALSSVFRRGVSLTQTVVIESEVYPRQWHVGVAPLMNDISSRMNAVIILEEITELTERERLLAWASFAREMAHEIKNPLTPMKLAAQHLRKAHGENRPDFDTVLAKATEMIERQSHRIEEIVREFSSFTKATGKEFTSVDLCAIVKECTGDFRYAAPQGVSLTARCPDRRVLISGDREAVRKILTNLIDNAIRAVGTEGKISISVEIKGDNAVLECIDNGAGIPKEIRSRIFEPGVSSRPGGTGLGLSICRSIVAAHGGRIEIMDSLSRGTGIRIEMPLHIPPAL